MSHSSAATKLIVMVMSVSLLLAASACATEEQPLPAPSNVTIQTESTATEDNGGVATIIVSWDASGDARVEGYAIYRAEQGIGTGIAERTDYKLQAITVATQYVDDELRTTERYPTTRYFYQVAVIGPGGERGPMSEEVSIDHHAST